MAETVTVTVNPGYSLLDGKKQHLPGDPVELPEKDAAGLIERGIVAPVNQEQTPEARQGQTSDDGLIAQTPDLEEMTVKEIKALLDKLGIAYDSNDRKAELIKRVKDNTAEAPEEG